MPRRTPPVVLTIAGFDPSSGAGATADLKTIAAHGCYGVACLTALTVQTTQGVRSVEPVPARLVAATLRELAHVFKFDAVKIGMLATAPVVDAVVRFLDRVRPPNVVLDPVLKSSSGAELLDHELLDRKGRQRLSKRLLRLATVITPNLDEAADLSGLPVNSPAGMKSAAERLHQMGVRNVVITGGHLGQPVDLLSMADARGRHQVEFASRRVRSTATHGTGCAFSSAVACNLALGKSLRDAVRLAKEFVTQTIRHAFKVGSGAGALNHFNALEEQLLGRRSTSQPLRVPQRANKKKTASKRR